MHICMVLPKHVRLFEPAHHLRLLFDTVSPVYSNAIIKHSTRTLQTQTAHKMLPAMKGCKSGKADYYLHRSSFKTETITGERDHF